MSKHTHSQRQSPNNIAPLLLCAAFLSTAFGGASGSTDYSPRTLYQLLSTAEIVVVGTIQSVSETTYELAISRVLFGSVESDVLSVERIDRAPLGVRAMSYAREQEVVLFATSSGGATWRPTGLAGEGELAAIEGSVFAQAVAGSADRWVRVPVPGTQASAYAFDRNTFMDAISGFFVCFAAIRNGGLPQRCSARDLITYGESSALAAHLARIAGRVLTQGDQKPN